AELRPALPLMIGGDWNLTAAWCPDGVTPAMTTKEGQLLARFEQEFGLRPAWSVAHAGVPLPRTLYFKQRAAVRYHIDGIFLSTDLCDRVLSATVLDGTEWNGISDHRPMVVELRAR
ncbi:MAG TPA: hypothetical protein VE869_15430, partial [Gemmatimonas sp.]|nr:hypothetical protein [Gemmatimonas sp.]